MKITSYILMFISLISLVLISFAYREFSLILVMLFMNVLLGLPLATILLFKRVNSSSQDKFKMREKDQEYELENLENRFNINSH